MEPPASRTVVSSQATLNSWTAAAGTSTLASESLHLAHLLCMWQEMGEGTGKGGLQPALLKAHWGNPR
jgi:hypothetical protein